MLLLNNNSEILKWKEFISENIRGTKTQQALIKYTTKLLESNSVVILDFEHLAKLLGITKRVLSSIVNSSSSFYYKYEIPKRNGGTREIASPFPVLLNSQRWIYDNLLLSQEIHESAKGFIRNKSIVDNAAEHLGNPVLLKMDIENFFPSIPLKRVVSVFRQFGYTTKTSYYLASICCLDGVLPQGAPTSPALSNIIAKRLDKRLAGLAQRFNLSYTRYADDLTFSGENLPTTIISYIEKITEEEGFKINKSKTKLLSKASRKIVTGISISSGKLTIPKTTKREIRKNIHHVLTKGIFNHQRVIQSNDAIYLERLLGYLYFWLSVEPKNEYILNSIKALRQYSESLDKEFKISIEKL